MVSPLKMSAILLGLLSIRGDWPKTKQADQDFKGLDRVIQIWSNLKQPNFKIG